MLSLKKSLVDLLSVFTEVPQFATTSLPKGVRCFLGL